MKSETKWPVWLFIPNIIGYLRVILTIVAFANYDHPLTFFSYYFTAFVLDAADGLAARLLNQSSYFGAQLDMLTDRCATAALLIVLGFLYPNYAFVFYALIFLDGYSHWMQMVAGMCAGATSHKLVSRGWLLKLYYWRPCLMFVCTLNEVCFLTLYMNSFSEGPNLLPHLSLYKALLYCATPICAMKQIISLRQILSAHAIITDAVVENIFKDR